MSEKRKRLLCYVNIIHICRDMNIEVKAGLPVEVKITESVKIHEYTSEQFNANWI